MFLVFSHFNSSNGVRLAVSIFSSHTLNKATRPGPLRPSLGPAHWSYIGERAVHLLNRILACIPFPCTLKRKGDKGVGEGSSLISSLGLSQNGERKNAAIMGLLLQGGGLLIRFYALCRVFLKS